jgi:hypothetical protein
MPQLRAKVIIATDTDKTIISSNSKGIDGPG